jgi:hypothetical protein
MIKFLKAFVNWCEKRWPEKIVLSTAEMEQVKGLLEKVGEHEARLKTLEIMTGFGVKAAKGEREGIMVR